MRCSLYDPAGERLCLSFIGFTGLMAGGGEHSAHRLDDALKYRTSPMA